MAQNPPCMRNSQPHMYVCMSYIKPNASKVSTCVQLRPAVTTQLMCLSVCRLTSEAVSIFFSQMMPVLTPRSFFFFLNQLNPSSKKKRTHLTYHKTLGLSVLNANGPVYTNFYVLLWNFQTGIFKLYLFCLYYCQVAKWASQCL